MAIISVISGKYNSGATTFAINQGIYLSQLTGEKTLLIDVHDQMYAKLAPYLLEKEHFVGLDDFINYFDNKGVNVLKKNIDACINVCDQNVDLVAHSTVKHLREEHIETLIDSMGRYKNILFDLNLNNPVSERILSKSDYIFLVVKQNRYALSELHKDLEAHSEKLHIVVNEYHDNVKMNISTIKNAIEISFNRIHKLNFDTNLLNYLNDGKVSKFVTNFHNKENNYIESLKVISTDVFGLDTQEFKKEGKNRWLTRFMRKE